MRVDQFMAGYAVGDATSHAALLTRDALRKSGYDSDIFCDPSQTMEAGLKQCLPIAAYRGGAGDAVIHHFGIWSETTNYFLGVPGRKILCYHNITPGSFFRGHDDALAADLDRSRSRLPELLLACDDLWAASRFNASELAALGFDPVQVFRLPFDTAMIRIQPDEVIIDQNKGRMTTILSVGRVAPNKRLEVLIRAFIAFRRNFNPYARLILAGSDRSAPRYVTYLKWLAHELHVPNVCFVGFVWPDALAAYYHSANLYVSTSGHEGYCLPLLEAMAHDIPVLSRRTGGTPEAMEDAGVLFDEISPDELAALMADILYNRARHTRVLAGQTERIRRERERNLGAELVALLDRAT